MFDELEGLHSVGVHVSQPLLRVNSLFRSLRVTGFKNADRILSDPICAPQGG